MELTWNANGSLQKLVISDPFNSSDSQTCTSTYDDVMRLVGNNCGSAWSQTFTFDAFGNIASTGSSSFQPTYNTATNRYATLPAFTPTYDANGNVLQDGLGYYFWDAEGRNTSVRSGGQYPLIYDALGRYIEMDTSSTSGIQRVYAPSGEEIGNRSQRPYFGVFSASAGNRSQGNRSQRPILRNFLRMSS